MAFTATQDLLLPAPRTGSWPRPRWYSANLWGRPLDSAMMDPWFREQFTDAHAIVAADQARAGLDILTTGDYHLDEDARGRAGPWPPPPPATIPGTRTSPAGRGTTPRSSAGRGWSTKSCRRNARGRR